MWGVRDRWVGRQARNQDMHHRTDVLATVHCSGIFGCWKSSKIPKGLAPFYILLVNTFSIFLFSLIVFVYPIKCAQCPHFLCVSKTHWIAHDYHHKLAMSGRIRYFVWLSPWPRWPSSGTLLRKRKLNFVIMFTASFDKSCLRSSPFRLVRLRWVPRRALGTPRSRIEKVCA